MKLNAAVLTTDTSITVTGIVATDNIPYREEFDIQIDNEAMRVVSNKGSSFIVHRGQRKTVIAAHADQTPIYNITGKSVVVPDTITDVHGKQVRVDSSLILDASGNLSVNNTTVVDTDAATVTFDFAKGPRHQVTLAGNRTFVFTNMAIGREMELILIQDGTGSRTVTWPSGIKWAGGSAPTLTTSASKADRVKIYQVASGSYHGTIVGQNY